MNYHYFPCLSCNKFFLLLIKLQKKFVTRLPLKITATKKIALKIKFSFLLLIQNNCLPTTNVPFEVLNQIVTTKINLPKNILTFEPFKPPSWSLSFNPQQKTCTFLPVALLFKRFG